MADQATSLPVRSEADGIDPTDGERVQIKVVDATTPSDLTKRMEVSEKLAHVRNFARDPAGTKVQQLLSEGGHGTLDGVYVAVTNTDPSNVGLVAQERNAAAADTRQTERITAKRGTTATDVVAMDVSMHDENGNPYTADNPFPVAVEDSEGDEIHDPQTDAAVAKDATANHDYVVASGKTFLLYEILTTASGKMKAEIQIGDGGAVEVFTSEHWRFNSTAAPNADLDFNRAPKKVVGTANGTTIRIIRTNRDNQSQDLYSTIVGVLRDT